MNSLKTQSRSRLTKVSTTLANALNMLHLLLLVSMDGQCRPSILTEVLRDVVRDTLSTDKDEHLRVLLADLIEVLDELATLLKVTHDLNDLLNVVVRCKLHRTDVDLDEVLEEVLWRAYSQLRQIR